MKNLIRNFEKCDWNCVAEIYKQGIESGIATFTAECPSYDEWDKMHLTECRFVYEESGKIIGWIALSPVSSRDVYKGVAEISVYVDNDYHGKGVGTALIEHLKATAPEHGLWSLCSTILEINVPSIGLHEKCGFRKIGYKERIAKDKFGKWQNTVLMEYRL